MKNVTCELVDLGVEHSQYFQGFGTSYTEYEESTVGAGWTALEAFDDAIEQVYSFCDFEVAKEIEAQCRGELKDCTTENLEKTVPEILGWETDEDTDFGDCEHYYYIGIRWKVEGEEE